MLILSELTELDVDRVRVVGHDHGYFVGLGWIGSKNGPVANTALETITWLYVTNENCRMDCWVAC